MPRRPYSRKFAAVLPGNRAGQYSIRVNMQWRICFTWNEGAENVKIVDYHLGSKI
ncbi:type II toxin-antitoxin system RelE/ParE family toxin [Nitrosospira sp. Nsp14]|uniref:type II toxin-antitoxin system RelE/ParE family toxin n=1 Tax=Nitrosospira sp. Nsp14 TaxID=1855333 RepID=UPI000B82EBBB